MSNSDAEQRTGMLTKIGELTKLALIPAAALYLLGFLSVTAYLSRFGIISFDILNARYLIAGVFPFAGMCASAALSFYFRQKVIDQELFTLNNSRQRWVHYGSFILSIFLIASVLNALLSFGRYREPDRVATLKHTSLGEYDLLGIALEWLHFDPTSDFGNIVKITIHLCGYLSVLALIILVMWKLARGMRRRSPTSSTPPAAPEQLPLPEISLPTEQSNADPLHKIACVVVAESLFASFLIALFFYSQKRLRAASFDFNSFDKPNELTVGLTFSWLYLLVLGTFLVVGLLPRDLKQTFAADELRKLIHPNVMWNLGYLVLIPLLASSFAFGAAIFPQISFSIGGGEPREAVVRLQTNLSNYDLDRAYLIGESGQFVYAVVIGGGEARALQINKDTIAYIETRKRALPHLGPPW
jgi:hypothetical protein